MAPAVAAVAVVAVVAAVAVAEVLPVLLLVLLPVLLPVLLLQVAEGRALLAHKLLLVRLQVAVVLAACRVALPPEAEVAALLLVQGLVASENLGSR